MKQAFLSIVRSRKSMIAAISFIVTIGVDFCGLTPDKAKDIQIAANALAISLIASIAHEDAAEKSADPLPENVSPQIIQKVLDATDDGTVQVTRTQSQGIAAWKPIHKSG